MPPLTRAEATSYKETSLHAHVMEFIAGLAARHDPRLAVSSFGHSPGGRDLPLCVLSAEGVRTPDESRRRGLPVVLIINGIHAGEVEGKESSLMLMRDLLDGASSDLLGELTLVVVPLFNPAANDPTAPANRRPNRPNLKAHPAPRAATRGKPPATNLTR